MPYEPLTGATPPPPKKFRFNKRFILVSLLLGAITAAAIVVIVIATTGGFSTPSAVVSNTTAQVKDGARLVAYDNQSSRLNGGVVCEDFAADQFKTIAERNFQVESASYRDEAGALVSITGDEAYDAALANRAYAATLTPVSILYYGQSNEWAKVGATFSCSLMAQQYDETTNAFVAKPADGNQALADNPIVFPVENVQIVQPSEVSSRLFRDQQSVLGFYDFFFNYFNHGPEIMNVTSISFLPSDSDGSGTIQLGDYSAPSHSLNIYLPTYSLLALNSPAPLSTSLKWSSSTDLDLARRISCIWPVLAHEYGHHMVETYGKRMAIDQNKAIVGANLALVDPASSNCASKDPAIQLSSFDSSYFNCDTGLFNYTLMDGILSESGYGSLLAVKNVNFSADTAPTGTFANAKAFPKVSRDYPYVISNEVYDDSNTPDDQINNDYRFSYDEIMARLYNLASAPYVNYQKSYNAGFATVSSVSDGFREEYDLHRAIDTEQFPATKPMIDSEIPADQQNLQRIAAIFEQMRASGAPLSYITTSSSDAAETRYHRLFGTAPAKEGFMLLRDASGAYSTLSLDYGVTTGGDPGTSALALLRLDNSMQLSGPNASATHGNETYEWYDNPFNYKATDAYKGLFTLESNNDQTYMATSVIGANGVDYNLLGKTLVGFTDTRLAKPSLLPPNGYTPLDFSSEPYEKAYFQTAQTRYFRILANSTTVVKQLVSVVGNQINYRTNKDSFSALVDTAAKTIAFGPNTYNSL